MNSKVPVILFDQWNRYKHCEAEESLEVRTSALYYVNNKDNLNNCIEIIMKNNEFDFGKYIFQSDRKKNIEKTMDKLL